MSVADHEGLDPAYAAFLDAAVQGGLVWGLEDEQGWALVPSEAVPECDVLPLWADAGTAAACACDDWADFTPQAIPLDALLQDWLPGMAADGLLVGVAWTSELEGVEAPPLELQADLEAAILRAEEGGQP